MTRYYRKRNKRLKEKEETQEQIDSKKLTNENWANEMRERKSKHEKNKLHVTGKIDNIKQIKKETDWFFMSKFKKDNEWVSRIYKRPKLNENPLP